MQGCGLLKKNIRVMLIMHAFTIDPCDAPVPFEATSASHADVLVKTS
jgi:hypothetical protein